MKSYLSKIKDIIDRFKGLTTIGLANIIANVISGLFWLYMARLLGTTNYGEVSYFIAIAGIGTMFSFVGAGNTLTVYTAKDVKIQASVYSISIISSIITSSILFILFFNLGLSLFVIGNVLFGLITAELLGRKLYKTYSIYLILQKILMASLAIALNHFIGNNGVILGIAISFFPAIIRIYQGFRESRIDFSIIRSKLGFIINSYILDISRTFSGTVDKVIIGPLFGFMLLGNYQLGIQFMSILGILPNIVYSYVLSHDASGNPNKKLKKLTILCSCVLSILGITLSPIVLPVFFPKFTEAIGVIQIMSLAIIPGTVNGMYISKFLGLEKSRIVLIGSGIYLSILVISIIGLGKILGINGIASAYDLATVSESIYLISLERIIQKSK